MAASGISFAIPSDTAREFLRRAKERVKTLKGSGGLAAPKIKPRERFYIGQGRNLFYFISFCNFVYISFFK